MRIISMLMIVIIHICSNGGVIDTVSGDLWKYIPAEFWYVATAACVNIYALISGFVGLNGGINKKLNRFFKLWVEVVFWCLLFAVIGYFGGFEGYKITSFAKSFLPIATNKYWYFSAYFGVVLIAPLINKAVKNLSGREVAIINIILFVFFSVYEKTVGFLEPPFGFDEGYSFAWLAYMCFVGGCMKKYFPYFKKLKRGLLITSAIGFVLTFVWAMLLKNADEFWRNNWSQYTSPTILIIAITFVTVFADMQFNKAITKIIKFLSPACFGVYLIHVNGFIWDNFWHGGFTWIANYNAVLIFFLIPLCAVVIYIACSLLEKLRIWLFKLLRIDKLCDIIYNAIYKIEIKYFNKFREKLLANSKS